MPNKLYEGGDDYKDADADADKPMSKADKKKAKYGDHVDGFSIKGNSKITDGVVTDRSCTDIICLGVFIAFIVMMLSFTAYGFAEGDVKKYVAPVNGNNEICGFGGQKGKDNLNFPTLIGEIWDDAVCVASCPSGTDNVLHYCIPTFSGKGESDQQKAFTASFQAMLNSNAAGRQFLDIYKSSTAVFIACGMSVVLCFGYIYLMSYFAEQIAWTIIGITQVGLFVGSAVCVFEYVENKGSADTTTKDKATMYLVVGIVLGLLALIMVCMLVCGFN